MKSVLISIRPEWVEKMLNDKKTIEVRKSAPKEVPFKCYIYCSYGNDRENYMLGRRGKVIGEFICDEIEPLTEYEILYDYALCLKKRTCLSQAQLLNYKGKSDLLYGWHISDLKIYDKPKDLSEFFTIADKRDCCYGCMWNATPLEEMPCRICMSERKYLSRPPQSWQFVEELKK